MPALKHTADKYTCAWGFKKPFIFCFIKLRCIRAKINEQFSFNVMGRIITIKKELLKYKLTSDDRCPFCLNPDSIEHTLHIVNYQMDSFPKL